MADHLEGRRIKKKGPDKPRRGPAGGVTGPAGIRLGQQAITLKEPGVVAGVKRFLGDRPAFEKLGTRTLQQLADGRIDTTRRVRTDATKELLRRKRENEK